MHNTNNTEKQMTMYMNSENEPSMGRKWEGHCKGGNEKVKNIPCPQSTWEIVIIKHYLI